MLKRGLKIRVFSARQITRQFDDAQDAQYSLAASPLELFVYQPLWEYEENSYTHNAPSSRHHTLTQEIASPLLQIVAHKQPNYVSVLGKLANHKV